MKNNFKNQNLLLISIHRKSLLKGYQESIEKLISKQILKNFDLGKTILKRKNIAVWGLVNTKENFKIWKNIQKSDVIMFLRDKKFFSKGIVVDTKEDNNISKKIWKDISFLEKRNLMIFLEKIEPIELEFDVCVPTLIEPNIPNAYFFPIKKIDDKKKNSKNKYLKCYKSLAEIYSSEPSILENHLNTYPELIRDNQLNINRNLIDFDNIPDDIVHKVINELNRVMD